MVRNTILEEEGSVQSKLKEAIFEPKMTRSKLREVMGNGQVPVSVYLTVICGIVCRNIINLYFILYLECYVVCKHINRCSKLYL